MLQDSEDLSDINVSMPITALKQQAVVTGYEPQHVAQNNYSSKSLAINPAELTRALMKLPHQEYQEVHD